MMEIHEELLNVLYAVHEGDVSVSSNFAREKSVFIAMSASMGLISTKITRDVYGRVWKLTVGGMKMLNETENEEHGTHG